MGNSIMLGASSLPSLDAVSHGVQRLGLDLGDALAPCLLQRGGNWFAELLPVIIFMAATILPSLAQARKKARERQAGKSPAAPSGHRSQERTLPDPGVQPALRGNQDSIDSAYRDGGVQPALRGRTSTSDATPNATPNATPKTAGSDLEARVRRYFEELAGPAAPQRTPPPAPPPARSAMPARPKPPVAATPPGRAAEKHGELVDVHVNLAGVSKRKKLPSDQRRSSGGYVPRRAQAQSGAQKGRTRVVHPLLRRTSIQDAVILREVLGPPKGLEGL